jgi:hypothetical protein
MRARYSARMNDRRSYSEAEVRAIVERALAAQASSQQGLTHDELLAVGAEVGVPGELMTRAADEVRRATLERSAMQAVVSRRRRSLVLHALGFLLLNGLLFAVNAATTPGEWWVLFPVFFWGLALLAHAFLTFASAPARGALERERRRLAPSPSDVAPKLRVAGEVEAEVTEAPAVSSTAARAQGQ